MRLMTVEGEVGREFLVGISCRTIGEIDLSLLMHQVPNFNAVNSSGVMEGLGVFGVVVGCHGEMQSSGRIIMVIMTSIGTPMGDTCSHSTGKIIFYLMG